jgi:hypothetical protein
MPCEARWEDGRREPGLLDNLAKSCVRRDVLELDVHSRGGYCDRRGSFYRALYYRGRGPRGLRITHGSW